MTHDQKARRIMELENALQKTNERISAAVAAEHTRTIEQCAKVAEDNQRPYTAAAIRALK